MSKTALSKKQELEIARKKLLYTAAKLFLSQGYTATTLKQIAEEADINIGVLMRTFESKENIIGDLVAYVLEGQFSATARLLKGITDDKILFYAAETTLQLYMAESDEKIRELYAVSYSLPHTTDIIQQTITGKLESIFREHLPHLETKDFFELEIASGGIMRGFMTIPCDMYFTIDRKVKRFIETTFRVYRVPDEKINEAIEFVSQFDFERIARDTINHLLEYLNGKIR